MRIVQGKYLMEGKEKMKIEQKRENSWNRKHKKQENRNEKKKYLRGELIKGRLQREKGRNGEK